MDEENMSTNDSADGRLPDPPKERPDSEREATDPDHENEQSYIQGPRLWLITAALSMCLFLTNLEIPIVTTALFGITQDLGGFNKASWVISSYLLGYVAVLIIYAKLSDIFGRKPLLILAVLIFVIFSGACSASQNINELIVFRAFQGIGGAGNYAMCTVIFLELVPSRKYAKYTSSVSVVYSLSLALGPVFGGAISQSTSWRWVFLLNVLAGAAAGLVVLFAIPNRFPHQKRPTELTEKFGHMFSTRNLRRIDITGTCLLLLATLSLVAALEEAGLDLPWRSAFVITLLTVSGVCWIAFFLWERLITLRAKFQEPVFPWRFVQSRPWRGMILSALFLGAPWFCAMFQLPQRLQIVNGVSPLAAGVRFIPFTLAAPLGSVIAPTIAKVGKVPPIYLVLIAAILQVVGFALMTTLPSSRHIDAAQYGYEVIAGFGCGINITLLILMTPFSVQERDKAVAMGAVAQFRVMGGAIGLAIITTAFNGLVRSRLHALLPAAELAQLLRTPTSITSYPPLQQEAIRLAFADGYNLQIKILAGLAAGQIPATFLMWQRKQIVV